MRGAPTRQVGLPRCERGRGEAGRGWAARAGVLFRAFDHPAFDVAASGADADVLLSTALHDAGTRFFAPPHSAEASGGGFRRRSRPRGWDPTAARAALSPSYAAHAGFDVAERVASGRAALGLLGGGDGPDGVHTPDVVAKLGSQTEFDRRRRAYA